MAKNYISKSVIDGVTGYYRDEDAQNSINEIQARLKEYIAEKTGNVTYAQMLQFIDSELKRNISKIAEKDYNKIYIIARGTEGTDVVLRLSSLNTTTDSWEFNYIYADPNNGSFFIVNLGHNKPNGYFFTRTTVSTTSTTTAFYENLLSTTCTDVKWIFVIA